MNSPTRASVVFVMFGLGYLGLGCLLGGFGSGCVAVNGGAVELAWTIRTEDARTADCEMQHIASVGVYVQACDDGGLEGCPAPDAAASSSSGSGLAPVQTFDCTRLRGSTDFSIAPGRKKIWIAVFCASGDAPIGVTVPEPILRDVSKGEVTELNALLISVPSTGLACAP